MGCFGLAGTLSRTWQPAGWWYDRDMGKAAIALYALALVAAIVAVDVLFLRGYFWARLATNVGIVLVFGTGYAVMRRRSADRA